MIETLSLSVISEVALKLGASMSLLATHLVPACE